MGVDDLTVARLRKIHDELMSEMEGTDVPTLYSLNPQAREAVNADPAVRKYLEDLGFTFYTMHDLPTEPK